MLTNVLVVTVLGGVAMPASAVNRLPHGQRAEPRRAAGFALIMGFGGAIISAADQQAMAKWTQACA
jgi:heat shock protein HtpX